MKILTNNFKKGTKTKFIKELRYKVKNNLIAHVDEAEKIAIKYLNDDYEIYEPTLAVTNFLPRTVKTILYESNINHPYFKSCKRMLYVDIWGRIWSKSIGILKNNSTLKLRYSEQFKRYSIDTLGGGMWISKRGKTFYCEYRSSINEFNNNPNPETFIG